MKKSFFISAIILTVVLLTTKLNAQTTTEEYNYVVKGYQIQLESGLDMKKGYEFIQMATYDGTRHSFATILTGNKDERTATLKKLVKSTGTEKKTVAYMVVYNKSESSKKEYICIPHPNSDEEILQKYWDTLWNGYDNASARLQIISYLISLYK